MAYPLPVEEQPLLEPRGHPTNIRTVLTDAAVEGWPEGVRETARAMAAGAWRNGAG